MRILGELGDRKGHQVSGSILMFHFSGFLDALVHSVNLENVLKDIQKPQENTSFP